MEKESKYLKIVKLLSVPWMALAIMSILVNKTMGFYFASASIILLVISLVCMLLHYLQVRKEKKHK